MSIIIIICNDCATILRGILECCKYLEYHKYHEYWNRQLLIIKFQLLIVGYQMPIVTWQLLIFDCRLSIVNHQLSIVDFQLPTIETNFVQGYQSINQKNTTKKRRIKKKGKSVEKGKKK